MDIISHRAKGKKADNPFSEKYRNKAALNAAQTTKNESGNQTETDVIVDLTTLQKMFLIRYKLINFINSAHDMICNQVTFLKISS